jgi:hypothetical protein
MILDISFNDFWYFSYNAFINPLILTTSCRSWPFSAWRGAANRWSGCIK